MNTRTQTHTDLKSKWFRAAYTRPSTTGTRQLFEGIKTIIISMCCTHHHCLSRCNNIPARPFHSMFQTPRALPLSPARSGTRLQKGYQPFESSAVWRLKESVWKSEHVFERPRPDVCVWCFARIRPESGLGERWRGWYVESTPTKQLWVSDPCRHTHEHEHEHAQAYTHVHMYKLICVSFFLCICTSIYLCFYLYIYINVQEFRCSGERQTERSIDVHICTYIYMHIHIYIFICIYSHAFTRTYSHSLTYAHSHTHTRTRTHTQTHNTHTHTTHHTPHTHTHTQTHAHTRIHVCVCVCRSTHTHSSPFAIPLVHSTCSFLHILSLTLGGGHGRGGGTGHYSTQASENSADGDESL